MAAENKKKPFDAKENKQSTVSLPGGSSVSPALGQILKDREAFWKNAITELEGKEFATDEEAVNCIIDLVLQRMQLEGQSQADVREFLFTMFESDPALVEELKNSLHR